MHHDLFTTARLREVGVDESEQRRLVRAGELIRVRHGVYRPGGHLDPEAERLMSVRGTVPLLDGRAVVSHASAAVLHALPVPRSTLKRVCVTRPGASRGYQTKALRVRGCPVSDDEIVEVDGLRVTSPARTAVDLARELAFPWAVGVVDAALRSGVRKDVLRDHVVAGARWPGNSRARAAVEFADGRSESVGESRSRVLFAQAGLPPTALQYGVAWNGTFVGRADFAWEDRGVLGEFDGLAKYGRLRHPDETVADAVVREKVREDRLRDAGYLVVRWTDAEQDAPSMLLRRVRAVLDAGPGRIVR